MSEEVSQNPNDNSAVSPGKAATQRNALPAKREAPVVTSRKDYSYSSDAQLRQKHISSGPATLVGLAILFLFFVSVIFWVMYVPVQAAVHAQAEVMFKNKRQTVQHLEGGIVKKILIRDGDTVQAGQPLIILENKQVQPIVRMIEEQNVAEKASIARLEAESKGLQSFEGLKNNKYMQTEDKLFKARQEAYQNQVELMHIQIAQTRESLKGLQERLALKNQEIASIREQLTANQDLVKDGFITRTVILDQQRVLAEKTGEREALSSAIGGEKQRIAELEQRILTLKSERVQSAVSELKQSSLRRIDQEERVRPMKDTLERQIIRAPVTGKVVGLKVSTVGGVIMPREPLMEIAPTDEKLFLEAKIEMKDITEVKIGQRCDIMIAGFDSRKVQPIRGKVIYISDDRIIPQSPGAGQQPYYSAHLEFDQNSLKNLGEHKLIPGMPAGVTIAIAPRSSLDFMIGPLRESARKALQTK